MTVLVEQPLTVLHLCLCPTLRRSHVTTNPIESMFDTVRDVSKRVTRWPTGTMTLRRALAGIARRRRVSVG